MKKLKTITLFFVMLCCLLTACSSPEPLSDDTTEVKSVKGVYDVDMTVKEDNGKYAVVITNNTENCAVSNTHKCNLYRQNGTSWDKIDFSYTVDDVLTYIYPFRNNNTEQWNFEANSLNTESFLTSGKYKIRVNIMVYDPVEFVTVGDDYAPKYKEKDAKEYFIETTFTVDER